MEEDKTPLWKKIIGLIKWVFINFISDPITGRKRGGT